MPSSKLYKYEPDFSFTLISLGKSSQGEGVCLVSHIRMRKEIWFFKDRIRVQTQGCGEVTGPLCV